MINLSKWISITWGLLPLVTLAITEISYKYIDPSTILSTEFTTVINKKQPTFPHLSVSDLK